MNGVAVPASSTSTVLMLVAVSMLFVPGFRYNQKRWVVLQHLEDRAFHLGIR